MVSGTRSRSLTCELNSVHECPSPPPTLAFQPEISSCTAANLLESGSILDSIRGITSLPSMSRMRETVTALAAGCWLLQPVLLSPRTWRAPRDCSGASVHSMDHVRHNRRELGPLLQLHCSFIGISLRINCVDHFLLTTTHPLDQLFHTTRHEILAAEFLRWHLLPQRAVVSTSARNLFLVEAGSCCIRDEI